MQEHGGSRWLLAGAAFMAVVLFSAACNAPSTFSVHGRLGGTADVVNDNGDCTFRTTTYEVGDDVVLRAADNSIVATDHLRKGPDSRSGQTQACDLIFQFDDVRPDDVAYQLTVDASPPVIVTERQLRDGGLVITPAAPATNDPNLKLKVQGQTSSGAG